MVGHERAARATLLPIRSEHEVVDDQLAAPVEEVGERDLALGRVENVILLDLHPGQLAPLGAQLVASPRGFLLLLSSSLRAAVHSSRDTTLCSRVNVLFCTLVITFSFLCLLLFSADSTELSRSTGVRDGSSAGHPHLRLRLWPRYSFPRWSGLGLAHGAHLAAGAAAAVEDAGAVGLEAADARRRRGISRRSRTSPRLRVDAAEIALARPPWCRARARRSTQETPVTKRSDSIVRRMAPVSASIWWILRARYSPTQSVPSAQVRPESRPWAGAGMVATTWPERGSTFWIRSSASCQRYSPSKAVPASAATASSRTSAPLAGIERDDALAAGEPDVRAVEGHAVDLVHAGIGAVFAEDLRLPGLALARRRHDPRLPDGQRARE